MVAPDNFSQLSRLGIGTYLGKDTDAVNEEYIETIVEAVVRGINVIDTAVNYRKQLSEHAIEKALLHLKGKGIKRDDVFISTKGGYIPGDARATASMQNIFRDTLLRNGVMKSEDIVDGCHCMSPSYLKHSLRLSLRNLRVDFIDLYYIHNPEQQLAAVDRATFERRMREAFETLEGEVAEGRIRNYGIATWNGCRVSAESEEHLDLSRLCELATEVGGADHHFRAVQAPFNAAMTELRDLKNQHGGKSVLEFAAEAGMKVFASASLRQGKLALRKEGPSAGFGGTPAQAALEFVLSTPGITTALVGCKTLAHLEENLGVVTGARNVL